MIIQTSELKDKLKLLIMAAGLDPHLPITQLVYINGNTFSTTDNVNTLYANINTEDDNLQALVEVKALFELVKRFTVKSVELTRENNNLIIKGNGTYILPIVLDSNGNDINVMDKRSGTNWEPVNANIKNIYKIVKLSVAPDDFAIPCYSNVVFSDKVISTDTSRITFYDFNIRRNPALVNKTTIQILENIGEFNKESNLLQYKNDDYWLVVAPLDISDYQIEDIDNLYNLDYENKAKINRKDLLALINRFMVFNYNFIHLSFNDNKLNVKTDQDEFNESLDIIGQGIFDFEIDVKILKQYITNMLDDEITLGFNDMLSLKDNTVEHILSVL